MKKTILLVLNYFIFMKGATAHIAGIRPSPQIYGGLGPGSNPTFAKPPPPFDRINPKCYPDTATAYFLPAPPSTPKVTVLDPEWQGGTPTLNFPEISTAPPFPNRVYLEPPCTPNPPTLALSDFPDKFPLLNQDKFNSMIQSDDIACNACAKLIEKLPIFNFDRELLDGFLAGIGL